MFFTVSDAPPRPFCKNRFAGRAGRFKIKKEDEPFQPKGDFGLATGGSPPERKLHLADTLRARSFPEQATFLHI
ncbi:hypothetical protein IT6_00640 [Methylacidiphilum caldifontis]|uniref:hypothetical protein n=1 Tax=Methylacidiphilum caldifontis TaxID=2795386 RepID=UPI001A8C8A21|nr:hypothetical protein [Methylacidiphilum caldifontis]QSR88852.1 hypothetical protein IT6_00640 [Methylacidiphilum caldifontis]